jgi:hypothetical protein
MQETGRVDNQGSNCISIHDAGAHFDVVNPVQAAAIADKLINVILFNYASSRCSTISNYVHEDLRRLTAKKAQVKRKTDNCRRGLALQSQQT